MKILLALLCLFISATNAAPSIISIGQQASILSRDNQTSGWQLRYHAAVRDQVCGPKNSNYVGLCLVVGDHGLLRYNRDYNSGSFTPVPVIASKDLNNENFVSAAYSAHLSEFVIVGQTQVNKQQTSDIFYSSDRVHWNKATIKTAKTPFVINAITWDKANQTFIAVGNNGFIATSLDGKLWQQQKTTIQADLLHIASDNNAAFIVPKIAEQQPQYIYVSSTGLDWKKINIPDDEHPSVNISMNSNNTYVVVNTAGEFFQTPSLLQADWTQLSLPKLNDSSTISAFNFDSSVRMGYFVGHEDGQIEFLQSGAGHWQNLTSVDNNPIIKLKTLTATDPNFTMNKYFTAAGSYGGYSDNLTPVSENIALHDVIHQNGLYLAVGDADNIISSKDGLHWNTVNPATINNDLGGVSFRSITYDNNSKMFYLEGIATVNNPEGTTFTSAVYASSDGEHWSLLHSFPNVLAVVIFYQDNTLNVASDSHVYSSSDAGKSWQSTTLTDPHYGAFAVHASQDPSRDNLTILSNTTSNISNGSRFYISTNHLQSWQAVDVIKPLNFIIWDTNINRFVGIGSTGNYATSTDGIHWEQITTASGLSKVTDINSLTQIGSLLYLNAQDEAGKVSNYVSSDNGSSWQQFNFSGFPAQTKQISIAN